MKRIGTLLSLLLVPFIANGQDTLTTMTYNLLNYQSGIGSRDQYYRTILRHVRPDLLVVQEISNSSGSTQQASVDSFYSRVVNVVFPGQFLKGTFIPDPNDTGNEIYYKPSKFTFVSNTPIHTALRDITEFKLYNAVAADTFRVYSVHLKAGNGGQYDTLRAAEVDSLRKVTNAFPAGKYFIVCGDFNIYGSTESAYQKLLQNNPSDDGHFLDALSLSGTWNAGGYAPYHTQSPRVRAFGGGATGGMDDRFDMILYSRAVSQPGKIQYLAGSLTPIGNDGLHYNDSINRLPNNAVPDSVSNALHAASDHLPVSARFVFSGGGGSIALLQKIVLRDNGGESDSLEYGTGVGATDGIDALFGEYEQPPPPPLGVFDVRWRITGTQGTKRDIRDTLGGTRVQVIYTGQIQAGTGGYPFVLRWNHSALPAGSFTLRDGPGGVFFLVNMRQQDSLLITDSNVQVFQVVVDVGNTIYSNVQQGWNIVSVPVSVADRSKISVFPTSTSDAFAYTVAGYVNRDTLDYEKGYWLKFPSSQIVNISGSIRNHDTAFVFTGWNLIGSTSVPVAVTAIQQVPFGIVSSSFFEYLGSYAAADSLRPAHGYWIKVNQDGLLILR